MLAGCPNAGTQPPFGATGSASPAIAGSPAAASASATPSAAASATSSSAPAGGTDTSASPDATGSSAASPAASAPAPTGATTILQGDVYNEAGAVVEGATVTVKSLDARAAYNATLTASAGHYVTNNVPVGVQLQITVSKPNWTSRTRVTALQANVSQRNTLNFGGQNSNADDAGGAPYFISNYPEIASTVPAPETSKGEKLSYKLRVSEPLDDVNKRRLENAIQISSSTPTPAITINKNSSFLSGREKVTLTWNAENTELTIAFNVPLRTQRTDKRTYSLSLTRATGDDLIVDGENNVLGFVAPNAGSSYTRAIKLASLKFTGSEANANDRWASTHTAGSGFDVAKNDTKPTVASVSGGVVTTAGAEYERFEITFDRAMLTYPERTSTTGPSGFGKTLIGTSDTVTDLANYAFAISDLPIKGLDMDKIVANPKAIDGTATAATVQGYMSSLTPFKATDTNRVHAQISASDPKVVQIDVLRSLIPANARFVRVRVDSAVLGPSGNRVSEANKSTTDFTADNVKDGSM
jgi:hypothetical protein